MTQREAGLFRLLGASWIYQGVQDALGAEGFRRRQAGWIDAAPGQRVLDIGCGQAAILAHLPAGVEFLRFPIQYPPSSAEQERLESAVQVGDRVQGVLLGPAEIQPGEYVRDLDAIADERFIHDF